VKRGLPYLLFLVVSAVLILAILRLNDGRFAYILDDPYIHLALAENLAGGHYGLSPGVLAAASSSVLWPFLIAPFAGFGFGDWAPLAINLTASLVTIALIRRLVDDVLGDEDRWIAVALTTAAFLATNVVGVAFTGMEHSLQLTCAVAVLYGLVSLPSRDGPPWWLLAALIAGPWLRYESLAVSVPGILLLLWCGHRRSALVAGVTLAGGLGTFALWLHSMGLGWFPTSVVAKSRLVADAAAPTSLAVNVVRSLEMRQGMLLAVFAALLVLTAFRSRGHDRRLVVVGLAAVGLHLVAGSIGYQRYEVYIVGFATLLLVHLYRNGLAAFVRSAPRAGVLAALAAGTLAVGYPYLYGLYIVPTASNNIYEQHYQMHRFVTDIHPATIAANDIGWISYGNDNAVVDLWGISSRDVLARRNAASGVEWIEELSVEHGVEYAILYAHWFPNVPANWRPVAEMSISRRRIYAAGSTVTFYSVAPGSHAPLLERLREFEPTLPKGVRLAFID